MKKLGNYSPNFLGRCSHGIAKEERPANGAISTITEQNSRKRGFASLA